MMKMISFILNLFLTLISCTIGTQKENNQVLKALPTPIDKHAVLQIQLFVADTSIIDLPSKQLTKLVDLGEGQCFVDSLGHPFYKPSQTIIFTGSDKDEVIDIFNSFLDSSLQDTDPTTCVTLYSHVFLLYDNKNKIFEQVDFAFDCPMQLDFLHRGKLVRVQDENSAMITKLVNKLKDRKAYIPVYGSPPAPK